MNKLLLLTVALLFASVGAVHASANRIDAYILKFETLPSGEYLIVLETEPGDNFPALIDPENATPRKRKSPSAACREQVLIRSGTAPDFTDRK